MAGGRGGVIVHALFWRIHMKRFTSALALFAFVAALMAPLAYAQGSTTPADQPAKPAGEMKADKPMKSHKMKAEKMAKIDINSCAKEDLTKAGIDDATADKIIAGRPYKSKSAVKKWVDAKAYKMLVAKQEKKAAAEAPKADAK
jgi:hypothetical protein